jgi:hypothetical protein
MSNWQFAILSEMEYRLYLRSTAIAVGIGHDPSSTALNFRHEAAIRSLR